MRRRTLLGAGLLGATGLGGPLVAAGVSSAERRLAQALREELPGSDLEAIEALAARAGWEQESLPSLSSLAAAIANDFRGERTVRLRRVRLSQTEAAWILACGAA